MHKIVIIKTGAAGDVVRTTSLLNVLKGNITWVVDPKHRFLFPDQCAGLRLITDFNVAKDELSKQATDLVLSLEENAQCAQLASSIATEKLVGITLKEGTFSYNSASENWFDMSLVSKKGKEEANALKRKNNRPFQYWLFKMVEKEFTNEPYVIFRNSSVKKIPGLIGVETRSGTMWPNKTWGGYEELTRQLLNDGYKIKTFTQKENIRDYLDEIATCSCIISGDSLPMHVALAYRIPCIAIFNCTPPAEIYDYGILTKIVSPVLESNLYSRTFDEEVVNSVSVAEVYNAFKALQLPK